MIFPLNIRVAKAAKDTFQLLMSNQYKNLMGYM